MTWPLFLCWGNWPLNQGRCDKTITQKLHTAGSCCVAIYFMDANIRNHFKCKCFCAVIYFPVKCFVYISFSFKLIKLFIIVLKILYLLTNPSFKFFFCNLLHVLHTHTISLSFISLSESKNFFFFNFKLRNWVLQCTVYVDKVLKTVWTMMSTEWQCHIVT